MALTHYQWTATGTRTETAEPCGESGGVDAENPRKAEAMIIGLCEGKGMQPVDINLTITRNS
ncbi:hypothetical protein [Streptomyces anulatus]|uniref:hypothetical protein n=1 Tax=Streptomyces anulatus TaxID=1892 RepID=UPI00324E0989